MILKSEKIKAFLSQKKEYYGSLCNSYYRGNYVIISVIFYGRRGNGRKQQFFLQMKEMENDIEKILSEIYGVGKCRVLITYKTTGEYITAKDISVSESGNGKNTDEKNLVTGSGNNEKPFVIKEKMPEIQGALVVCRGGENIKVKNDVIDAVCALTGLPQNRVKVFKK